MVGSETMVRNSRKIVWPLSTLFASVNTWWPRLGWKKFCTENAPIRMVCNVRHSPRIGRTRARVIIGCAEKNPPRGWMTSKGWAGALCGVERSKSVSRRFETLFAPRFSSFSRPREREKNWRQFQSRSLHTLFGSCYPSRLEQFAGANEAEYGR